MKSRFTTAILISLLIHISLFGFFNAPLLVTNEEQSTEQKLAVLGVIKLPSQEAKKQTTLKKQFETQKLNSAKPKQETKEAKPVKPKGTEIKAKRIKESTVKPNKTIIPTVAKKKENPGKKESAAGNIKDIRVKYLKHIIKRIEQSKHYPRAAYYHDIEGTIQLRFNINRDGSITKKEISIQGTNSILVKAGQTILDKASPFKPVPKELQINRLQIEIPVTFKIEHTHKNLRKEIKGNE
jgi:TonB family protein